MEKKLIAIALQLFILALSLTEPTKIRASDKIDENNSLKKIQDLYMAYSNELMIGDFKEAYDKISSFIKKSVSYESFVGANQIIMKEFLLKGSQLSNLNIRGKYAAAKATTYIDFLPKKDTIAVLNCKIEAPVFFILEKNDWKIATGTDSDTELFVKEHPEAAGLIPPVKTRIFYKYKGYWVSFDFKFDKDQKLVVPQSTI